MTSERLEGCGTCPFHQTEVYRTTEAEKDIKKLEECFNHMKRDVTKLERGQALMQQKFDNIRYPIWIIFAAVLVQVAKALITFAPAITNMGEVIN
jgi:hypothetical protein